MVTLGELLADARRRLSGAAFTPPLREASLLASRVLELSEAQILAHPESPVPPARAARYERLLRRRLSGEPVAYLLQEREFYGRPFYVDRRVLIPRPETEHLVEAALAHLRPGSTVLDVGTGSGCIALTLALERPRTTVVGTDRSLSALAVAAINRDRYALGERLRLLAADLLAPLLASDFSVVVANLPYVDPADASRLSPEIVHFEPAAALFSTATGTAALERLLVEASVLRPGTVLLLEIGMGQLPWLERTVHSSELELACVHDDYARIPRVAELRRC